MNIARCNEAPSVPEYISTPWSTGEGRRAGLMVMMLRSGNTEHSTK